MAYMDIPFSAAERYNVDVLHDSILERGSTGVSRVYS